MRFLEEIWDGAGLVKKAEDPAQSNRKSESDKKPLSIDSISFEVHYRQTAVNWCADRLVELEDQTPYATLWQGIDVVNHMKKLLTRAIEYLGKNDGSNLRFLERRAEGGYAAELVNNIISIAQKGKARWNTIRDLPGYLESEREKRDSNRRIRRGEI